jgi:hypothetical protein
MLVLVNYFGTKDELFEVDKILENKRFSVNTQYI